MPKVSAYLERREDPAVAGLTDRSRAWVEGRDVHSAYHLIRERAEHRITQKTTCWTVYCTVFAYICIKGYSTSPEVGSGWICFWALPACVRKPGITPANGARPAEERLLSRFLPPLLQKVPQSRLEGYLDRSQAGDHQVDALLKIGQRKTVSDDLVHRQ
jgi:hypothetical protein